VLSVRLVKTLLVLLSLVAACGGNSSPATCSWPAEYDVPDSGVAGLCGANRYYLKCTNGGGIEVICPSADRDSCTPSITQPGTTTDCTSVCHDDEYVFFCGEAGRTDPPSSCRMLPSSAGTFACCPCGS
jgi:hypothetical protein